MLTHEQKQHYVAVKKLNSLLKDEGKCSEEHFCINCFRKFKTKSSLEIHYQVEDANHFHSQNLNQFHSQ